MTATYVQIEKLGKVKLSEKNRIPVNAKYSNPRVTYDGLHWYVSVGVEEENNIAELTSETIGVDVGIKVLAVCSKGKVYKNINKSKTVKRLKKKLRKLQRKVSRKYEMGKEGNRYHKTSNIIKSEKELLKVHKRLTNIRTDYIHKVTTEIVKTKPSKVVMETLNIQGMMKNKHLSKAIQEQCLYEFKRQMQYKCGWNGIEFVEADMWYPSSKTCSKCGHIKCDLKLSNRTYICEACGNIIDRDLNASINLSRYEESA